MVGKYSALAAPICALAAISCCSACSRSGRRSSSCRRHAGRHLRQLQVVDRLAAHDRPRVAADQHRQRALRLRDLRFDQRDLRGRGLVLRLRLRHVHHRHLAVLELQREQVHRFLVGLQRLLRHVQLRVQPAQLQVAVGHLRHQRQDHAAPRLVGGQHVGIGGFGLAADAAPQVDLPAGLQRGLVGRGRVRVVRDQRREGRLARALALRAGAVAEVREELRARLRQQRRRLLDVGRGDLRCWCCAPAPRRSAGRAPGPGTAVHHSVSAVSAASLGSYWKAAGAATSGRL